MTGSCSSFSQNTVPLLLSTHSQKTAHTIPSTDIHIVPVIADPIRIQEYGVGIFEAVCTKSALKKALKNNWIKVNDRVATTATWINGGERIQLTLPNEDQRLPQWDFPLEVLFEDDYLAIIKKPAGIVVSGNKFRTVANALTLNLQPSSLTDAATPQPVHRLDYPTSGILLASKTRSSTRILNQMFSEKKIRKVYYAICIGKMKEHGTICSDIEGKRSQSDYRIISSVPSKRFGILNLVQLIPLTGRRHQLRKHLYSIHNPILGDKDYAIEDLILKGKGLYLHASSLEFTHPFTKKRICIKDELPEKFRNIFGHIALKAQEFRPRC